MISNLSIFLDLARESLANSEKISAGQGRPKPNGEKGEIINFDPRRQSFKQALISIAFAGVYLDALLHLEGVSRLGKASYEKFEKKHYEAKLQALGITDSGLLRSCRRFRESRNDLMHEKPIDLSPNIPAGIPNVWRTAQEEARHAIDFIDAVTKILRP
jgi:hypothetical protein